jgi:hypothetical protein
MRDVPEAFADHVIPSVLVIMRFVPVPPTTQREPFHATAFPEVVRRAEPDAFAVQVVPFVLVIRALVP